MLSPLVYENRLSQKPLSSEPLDGTHPIFYETTLLEYHKPHVQATDIFDWLHYYFPRSGPKELSVLDRESGELYGITSSHRMATERPHEHPFPPPRPSIRSFCPRTLSFI